MPKLDYTYIAPRAIRSTQESVHLLYGGTVLSVSSNWTGLEYLPSLYRRSIAFWKVGQLWRAHDSAYTPIAGVEETLTLAFANHCRLYNYTDQALLLSVPSYLMYGDVPEHLPNALTIRYDGDHFLTTHRYYPDRAEPIVPVNRKPVDA